MVSAMLRFLLIICVLLKGIGHPLACVWLRQETIEDLTQGQEVHIQCEHIFHQYRGMHCMVNGYIQVEKRVSLHHCSLRFLVVTERPQHLVCNVICLHWSGTIVASWNVSAGDHSHSLLFSSTVISSSSVLIPTSTHSPSPTITMTPPPPPHDCSTHAESGSSESSSGIVVSGNNMIWVTMMAAVALTWISSWIH